MLIGETLPFVQAYVKELDAGLRQIEPQAGLTRIQQGWLGFCLAAILVTDSICWKRFERASVGRFSAARLSWMFRQHQCWIARLSVCAHGTKRFVIALKYEGEERSRYLVASDMSWRTPDIVQAHTLRWLVEVFLQDWKAYEGWGQLTKQPDEEGSRRSLTLSLLCDHGLLLYPDQLARVEDNLPAYTVGSLRNHVKVDSLIQFFKEVLSSEHPQERLELVAQRAHEVFTLNTSSKHMVGRDVGRLQSTPSLKYRANVVMNAT